MVKMPTSRCDQVARVDKTKDKKRMAQITRTNNLQLYQGKIRLAIKYETHVACGSLVEFI